MGEDKSRLFKQVDNSQLDELIGKMWRRASIDANSSDSVCSPPSTYDRSVNTVLSNDTPNTNQDSLIYENDYDHPNQQQDHDLEHDHSQHGSNRSISSPESISDLTVINLSDISALTRSTPNNLCTIQLDMTYEDRVFFGVHNFYQLKKSLIETQCNVDFSAVGNKVSIIGQISNVQKMCEMFISNSTLSLQIEFRVYDEKYLELLRNSFSIFHQQCELNHKVYVAYRRNGKPNQLTFNFISFRNNSMGLIRAMIHLKNELEQSQIGEFTSNLSSSFQIPSNRRDLTGRSNMFIEQIQKQTKTKIELIRYEDCPQYPFENVTINGTNLLSVIEARYELMSRFTFELKFQVFVNDTRMLVEYIAKLSNELKSIFISIEPCPIGPNMKIISITGFEKNIRKLFTLREQLLDEVYNCNNCSMMRSFLT
ncbi:hypothetical protein RDWZM_007903 [Blomia tropicalis]|uniref:K Homology domain-containing protein n=1 Tax=Blomia tropicalis TaxID=40697 RepID=A0A9Q0RKW7_BLOTA|nr:hypothetical protein RDWZM_007903 [Blomia tropicalis]